MKHPLFTLLFVAICLVAPHPRAHAQTPSSPPETRFGVRMVPGPMDTVLLKDYKPESSLVVPRSEIAKARFPVIDAHTHNWMSPIIAPGDVDAWVKTMDAVGVECTIVFMGAYGEAFAAQVPSLPVTRVASSYGALSIPAASTSQATRTALRQKDSGATTLVPAASVRSPTKAPAPSGRSGRPVPG